MENFTLFESNDVVTLVLGGRTVSESGRL